MGAEPSPAAVAFAASVGLPKSAASLSPLTLLWLASRLDEAAVRKAAAAIKRDAQENGDEKRGKKDGPVPNGTTHTNGDSKPNGDSNGNGNGAVATEEGEDTEGEDEAPPRTEWWWRRMNSRNIRPMPVLEDYADHLRKATTVRPVTAFNSRILVQLLPLLFPRLVVLARNNTKYLKYALLYLSSVILTGLLPTGLLWARAKLLDLVEESLAGKRSPWSKALKFSTLAVLFSIGGDVYEAVIRATTEKLRNAIESAAARVHISAKLDIAQHPKPNQVQEDLVMDAGVFGGIYRARNKNDDSVMHDGTWGLITCTSKVVSDLIEMTSQAFLLLGVLRKGSAKAKDGKLHNYLTLNNLLVLSLSFAPAAAGFLLTSVLVPLRFYEMTYRGGMVILGVTPDEMMAQTVRCLTKEDRYKNELVLFSLKDWVMDKWEDYRKYQLKQNMPYHARGHPVAEITRGAVREITSNIFSVLIATRVIRTNMTLGDIHLHKRVGEWLIRSGRHLQVSLHNAYQVPFFLAASLSCAEGLDLDGTTLVPKADFEEHRLAGGMRIEARNLKFSYGTTEVLHDINIVIEPGQSLAVVGVNGCGKTTLVKTLLGLHDHRGQVLVNGRDIREFSPQSLHGRMSCLFQDYCKYDLTLRDNVGLGDLKRMGEDKTIMTAVERGGAKALHEALGPSTWLTASWPGFANSALNEQGIKKKNKPMTHRRAGATKKKGNWLSDFVEYVFNIQPDTDNKEKKKQDGETCSLSGGQWQRVALSRAFMRADTADLIVFDEPSASLDPIAEATLFDRIHSLSRVGNGATTIFISHRFNTVRRADKIIFVDKGRIIEYGSHEELMGLKGRYFECFDLQRRGFMEVDKQ